MDARTLAGAQGAYYVVSGIWPIVHPASFTALTGDKRERWLMKSFGCLLAGVGAALLAPGLEDRARRLLGGTAAGAVAVPDLWFGLVRRRIPWPYVADGLVQAALVGAWLAVGEQRTEPDRKEEPMRCGHDDCRCEVEAGQSFCSDVCRQHAGQADHQAHPCDCGHPACQALGE